MGMAVVITANGELGGEIWVRRGENREVRKLDQLQLARLSDRLRTAGDVELAI